ncbi:hypothetical protein HY640_04575 [Candidatus Woesearchaeota archaeon]|nr:hypothetical protein [Candidatus Woesearchaeota archaeon]
MKKANTLKGKKGIAVETVLKMIIAVAALFAMLAIIYWFSEGNRSVLDFAMQKLGLI